MQYDKNYACCFREKLYIMKILFVANVAKEHILKFHIPSIRKFKEIGWQVDVACSGEEKVPYCASQFQMSWKRSPFSIKTIIGIFELRKRICENKYDVIYCHTPVGGFIARLAARKIRKKGTKVIYFSHGFHFFKGAPLINWLIYYPIEKLLARWTDLIITINKEDYINAKEKLKVLKVCMIDGMGIDLKRFQSVDRKCERMNIRNTLRIPQDAWVMIYLAELLPNKNQSMLLDTLKLVKERNSNTYLLLAGIDHYKGKFQEYAKKIGVYENVRFLGWRDDTEKLYAAADVCTATSIREGFGLNLVEALAAGIPIVATRNRGHVSIIQEAVNGYLIDVGDCDAMAERICQIMMENKLHPVGIEQIEKYDSDVIVNEIITQIKEIRDI